MSVIFQCTRWFSPVSNLGTSVQCLGGFFKQDKSKQNRKPEMRRGGGGRGVTGLDSAGACGEARCVSYLYGTCRGSLWLLRMVGGLELLGPQGGHELSLWEMSSGSHVPNREGPGSHCAQPSGRPTAVGHLSHVGRPVKERRAWRNVRCYAHCPLAAGSHLLFRSVGGVSQRELMPRAPGFLGACLELGS